MADLDEPWPLVGRDAVLSSCGASVVEGRSVLLAGLAGIGKTRIAYELAEQAESRMEVVRLAASVTAELPRSLLQTGADRRTLLVVDDIHRLDADSESLLHDLVAKKRVQLLATLRTGESSSAATVTSLWKRDVLQRVELGPLTRGDVDMLLDRVLDGPIEASTRLRFWEMTRGAPLYLRELVRAAHSSGTLRRQEGMWRMDGVPTSAALDELIELRFEDIDAESLVAVELVAVAEVVGFDHLESACGDDPISRAERAGLIEVVRDGRRVEVRMVHPIYADVVQRRMGFAATAQRSRTLLELLEQTPMARRDDIVRASKWHLQAGGKVVSDDMVLAARRALHDKDEQLALELARRSDSADHVGASIVMSEALVQIGDPESAERLLREVGGEVGEMDRALVATQRAIALFWGMGEADLADQVLVDAEAGLGPGAWRDELRAERSVIKSMRGDATGALELARPLLEASNKRVYVTAAIAVSVSDGLGARCLDAAELSRLAQAESAELSEQAVLSDPAIHIVAEALALSEAGQLGAADDLAALGRAVSLDAGLRPGQAWFGLVLGRIRLLRGSLVEAATLFDEAVSAFAQMHSNGPRRWAGAGSVLVAALQDDRPAVEAAWSALQEIPPHPALVMGTEIERAAAWRQYVLGDRDAAFSILRTAAQDAITRGGDSLAMAALHDLIRLDAPIETSLWDSVRLVQGEWRARA